MNYKFLNVYVKLCKACCLNINYKSLNEFESEAKIRTKDFQRMVKKLKNL